MLKNLKNKIFYLVCFSMLLSGCATVPSSVSSQRQGLLLRDVSKKYGFDMQWDSVSRVVTLVNENSKIKVLIGSNMVLVDSRRVALNAPVEIVDSAIVVPTDFKTKVFLDAPKIVRKKEPGFRYRVKRRIVLDPGHGGKDPGAIGRKGLREKEVVLEVSKYLKSYLRKKGFEVVMTRDNDKFISLNERGEITSKFNCDLFVSIHANSSPSRKVTGVEVFYLNKLGYLDRKEEQRKKNHKIMYKSLKMKKGDYNLEKIVSDMLFVNKQSESEKLASIISAETSRYLKAKNRGAKKARFHVLRNTLVPAVLVEVGFLSNYKEEKKLKTSLYRKKIAEGIARGIIKYSESAF